MDGVSALPDELLTIALCFVGAEGLARAACASRRLAALASDVLALTCRAARIWPPAVDGWAASRKVRFVEARARAAAQAPLIAAGHAHCAHVLADGTVNVSGDRAADHCACAPPRGCVRALCAALLSPLATPVDGPFVPLAAVSAGDGFTVAASADGRAFAWGDASDGALGLGLARGAARVRAPRPIGALSAERVVGVAAGFAHSLFVTERGEVFSAGWAHGGRLGRGHARAAPVGGEGGGAAAAAEERSAVPRRIDSLSRAAHAVGAWAGEDHSIVLDAEGCAWTFGGGRDGQLGHADAAGALHEPARVRGALAGETLVGAAAGERHSLFLNSVGRIFACGCGEGGRLGLGDERPRAEPERLVLADGPAAAGLGARAVACAAGARHSAAVDECGRLWLWGELPAGWEDARADTEAVWGAVHALSTPASAHTAVVVVATPRRAAALLPSGVRATAVACGAGFTLALGSDGQCYALGRPAADESSPRASDEAEAEVGADDPLAGGAEAES